MAVIAAAAVAAPLAPFVAAVLATMQPDAAHCRAAAAAALP